MIVKNSLVHQCILWSMIFILTKIFLLNKFILHTNVSNTILNTSQIIKMGTQWAKSSKKQSTGMYF